jgi:predicted PurR-regulated permease PerM
MFILWMASPGWVPPEGSHVVSWAGRDLNTRPGLTMIIDLADPRMLTVRSLLRRCLNKSALVVWDATGYVGAMGTAADPESSGRDRTPDETQPAGEDGPPGDPEPTPPVFAPWSRAFVRHAALWLTGAIVAGLFLARIADSLAHRLAGFFQILLVSLFLSFAIEPAVGYLARKGWRRGAATGLIFVAVAAAAAALIALLIPAITAGTRQLITALPGLVNNLARYLEPLGIHLDKASIEKQVSGYGSQLVAAAQHLTGGVLHLAAGITGAIFQVSAIALFTFYMVARGPQLRRTVLSWFRPRRQHQIAAIWEEAIEQTGGYFYSRLLIAVVNGTLMYVVLRVRGVPFAAPLAVFEAAMSTFIPAIGSYLGGAAPVLVALLYDPVDAIVVLVWIVIYQQIENYLLAPRLTARTMDVSAPIAFAAALIGGLLGGFVFAFLSLPVAGIIQSVLRTYGRRYQVTEDGEPPQPRKDEDTFSRRS